MRIGTRGRPSERRRGERGFTLLELLVVLVILGLLAAVAAPRVLKYLGSARADTAKLQINNIGTALDLYRLEVGRYPSQNEGLAVLVENVGGNPGWNGPYLKKKDAITDPWGRPYHYRQPGEHGEYDLYTLGADNASGGDGENRDIGNW
jgi:general secretion pathway protein G